MEIAERAEVAKVGTQAHMRPEEEHRAAAKVPAQVVDVAAECVAERVDLGSNQPEADQGVGAKSDAMLPADRNADQQIASRGQDAAAAEVGPAEEIRAMRDIRLEAEHAIAHVGEAASPRDALGVDGRRELTARPAAEVHADERDEQPVGVRDRGYRDSDQQAQCECSSERHAHSSPEPD